MSPCEQPSAMDAVNSSLLPTEAVSGLHHTGGDCRTPPLAPKIQPSPPPLEPPPLELPDPEISDCTSESNKLQSGMVVTVMLEETHGMPRIARHAVCAVAKQDV